jgi:hypothetical protein
MSLPPLFLAAKQSTRSKDSCSNYGGKENIELEPPHGQPECGRACLEPICSLISKNAIRTTQHFKKMVG